MPARHSSSSDAHSASQMSHVFSGRNAEAWRKDLHDADPARFDALFPTSRDLDLFAFTGRFCHVNVSAHEKANAGTAAFGSIPDAHCPELGALLIELGRAASGVGTRGDDAAKWTAARKAITGGFLARGTINSPRIHAVLRLHLVDDDEG